MTLRVMTTLNFEKQVLSVLPVLKFFIYLPHMLTALKQVWKKLSFFFSSAKRKLKEEWEEQQRKEREEEQQKLQEKKEREVIPVTGG